MAFSDPINAISQQLGLSDVADSVGGLVEDPVQSLGATSAADRLMKASGWLSDRHNWARIAWFTAGYAMIVAGLVIISKPVVDQATGAVAGTVGTIAKAVI